MSTAPKPSAPAPLAWKLALLLPVLAHAVGVGLGVIPHDGEPIRFGRLDLTVLLAVFGYVAAIPPLTATRRRAAWSLAGVGLFLAGLFAAEAAASRAVPPTARAVPQLPMRATAALGAGFGDLSGRIYEFSVNSLGLRGPEMDLREAGLTILCVGGGTAACPYTSDADTWPWALQDNLEDELGKPVFVGNAARRFYTTINVAQLLREYVDEDLIPDFDWVVVLCGFEDWGNDLTFEEAERVRKIRDLPIPETLLYPEQSTLYYRNTGLARLQKRRATWPEDPTGQWVIKARSDRADLRAVGQVVSRLPGSMPDLLEVYRQNLKAIHDACRSRSAKPLFLTQPTLHRPDLPREAQELLWKTDVKAQAAPTVRYLHAMNRAYNDALVEFCQQQGVDYIDLDALLPKDPTHFYDDCHLTRAGCAKVAEVLTGFFVKKVGPSKESDMAPR